MSENIVQLNEEVILITIGFTIGYRNDYMVLVIKEQPDSIKNPVVGLCLY